MKTNKLFALSALFILTSCGGVNTSSTNTSSKTVVPSESSSEALIKETKITDMVGREVTITPGTYSKVVCIGAGALRLFSYIEEASLLAGVEDIENYTLSNRPKMFDGVARPYFIANKEVYKNLPSCGVGGPNAQAAEAEKILSCDPDIVLSLYEDVEKEDALQTQLGVPVVTLRYGSAGIFDSKVKDSINLLGTIFNKTQKANTLNDFIASERKAIEDRVKNVKEEDKKFTYICGLGNWGTTNHLMTSANFEPFNVANIKNVASELTTPGIFKIEAEKFVELAEKTDVMIIDAAAVKNIKPLYKEDPTMFDFVKAVKDNEVYLQMAYNAYYTNLEIALANTWFEAKCVYPSLFNDIDMVAKTNEITKAFLGVELASEIYAYPNSFGGYGKINVGELFNG